MSTATLTHGTASGLRHYIADVVNAARAFAAALFAAQERQFVARPASARAVSPRALEKSRLQLLALAKECQQFSPNQSAELRNFASRDPS